MTPPDGHREKAPGLCDNCGEFFTVWVWEDGTVLPVSPNNACGCDEPSLRTVDETDVFENDEEQSRLE